MTAPAVCRPGTVCQQQRIAMGLSQAERARTHAQQATQTTMEGQVKSTPARQGCLPARHFNVRRMNASLATTFPHLKSTPASAAR